MDKIGQSLRFSASSSLAIWLANGVRSDSQTSAEGGIFKSVSLYLRSGVPRLHGGKLLLPLSGNCFRVSLLIWLTPGNRSRHSYGRVASMIIRELWPFWPEE